MKRLYYATVFTFAITSVALAILDMSNLISISKPPYFLLDKFILLFFWIDYIVRFFHADNKWKFFKSNIFDLIAIIPFDSFFSVFRIARTIRLIKLVRLVRIIGFAGRLKNNLVKFINTNGFIYIITFAIMLVLTGAGAYSLAEGIDYGDSLWWAIVTTTTVGYGDISPHTAIGKGIAIVLMFVGIGIIGSITSTVTSFFTAQQDEKTDSDLTDKLDDISSRLDRIEKKLGDE